MGFEEKSQNCENGSISDYQKAKDQVRACLESRGKRGLFFTSKHLTLMDPVNQVLCSTICVAQILRCHFSPTIYVKLFALSSPCPPDLICQRSLLPLSGLRWYVELVNSFAKLKGGTSGPSITVEELLDATHTSTTTIPPTSHMSM